MGTTQAGGTTLFKAIGPGILVACAAVGGSHLVWSTRAGAEFGWSLVGLVLLANFLKFPFFLYGQRYAAATGESLLAGYMRQGRAYVWIFLGINILTGAINIAGVSMLSGALLAGYGLLPLPIPQLTLIVLAVSAAILLLGHYRLLDGMAKTVILVLAVSTFVALGLAVDRGPVAAAGFEGPSPYTLASFAFLISLLGWMPAPIDLSAWSSLWMFSRRDQTGHLATVRETSIDFHLGYVMTVVLAVVFLALGKYVMFGSGESFSSSGIAFSNQLVGLYSTNIGEWSRPLILTAAFVTMFSTTVTCLDGYPRSLAACCTLLGDIPPQRFRTLHNAWIVLSLAIASIVVLFLAKNLIQMLTFAAIVSFVTSPVLAWINLKVMSCDHVPREHRPGVFLRLVSVAGLAFFILMTAGYLYTLAAGH